MRYIFCLLLCLNAFGLAWGVWFHGEQAAVAKPPAPLTLPNDAAEIQLLGVTAGTASKKPENGPLLAGSRESLASGRACYVLGPLFGGRQVQDLVERIRLAGAHVILMAKEGELEQDYWVMIPPQGSRQEAQLRYQEFQARDIDSFVITQGAMKNAVSLGLFTQQELADEHGRKLRALGYGDVEVQPVPRENQEVWLRIVSKPSQEAGESPSWVSLLKSPAEKNWKREDCTEALLSAAHELEFGAPGDR